LEAVLTSTTDWKAGIEKAVSHCKSSPIIDTNEYVEGYIALCSLFSSLLSFETTTHVEIGAHAVYGWMPTMLKRLEQERAEKLRIFAKKWKSATCYSLSVLKALEDLDLKTVNNSVVGTSKFLHFVAPDVFPIWDSRVAAVFGLKYDYKINNEKTYREFVQAIHMEVEERHNPTPWDGNSTNGISKIRNLELCLFRYGKALQAQTQ
jgi:hypothetical protein